jgi:cell pole-organizing protein PopZ
MHRPLLPPLVPLMHPAAPPLASASTAPLAPEPPAPAAAPPLPSEPPASLTLAEVAARIRALLREAAASEGTTEVLIASISRRIPRASWPAGISTPAALIGAAGFAKRMVDGVVVVFEP